MKHTINYSLGSYSANVIIDGKIAERFDLRAEDYACTLARDKVARLKRDPELLEKVIKKMGEKNEND